MTENLLQNISFGIQRKDITFYGNTNSLTHHYMPAVYSLVCFVVLQGAMYISRSREYKIQIQLTWYIIGVDLYVYVSKCRVFIVFRLWQVFRNLLT